MKTKQVSVLSAVGAFCLALLVFPVFVGCENPSTEPLRAVLYPAPNPGPSLTPGDGEIEVQFTSVVGATGYLVRYGTSGDPGAAQTQYFAQSTTNLAQDFIRGLTNGVTYYIWVEAWFGDDERSALTPPVSATPRARPPAPQNFTAIPNDKAFDLMWDPVVNPAHSADSYIVYWSATGGDEPPEDAPHAEFYVNQDYLTATDTNAVMGYVPNYVNVEGSLVLNGTALTNESPYHVWIKGKNTTGESAVYAHDTKSPNPAAGAPVTPPGKPALKPGDGSLLVTWNAVRGATGYRLYYSTTETVETNQFASVNAGAGRTTGTISGLTNKTPYSVWVAAVNGAAESAVGEPYDESPYPPPPLNMSNPSQEIGYAPERFPNEEAGKGDRLSRKQETALGDLVGDAMFYWADKYKGQKAPSGQSIPSKIDFAFFNGGVILNALEPGPIQVSSIMKLLHGDQMSVLTMTGAQIKTLFTDYVVKVRHDGGGGSGTGAFGQVSGQVHFSINYHNDSRGGTLEYLKFKNEDFVDTTSYTFVTNTYLTENTDGNSGDGYMPILTQASSTVKTSEMIMKAVCEWIYDETKAGRNITPKTDGRIVLVDEVWRN